jgi:amino acid permease
MSIHNESIHSSSEGGGAEEKLHKFNPLPHAPEPPKSKEVKVYQTEENIYSKETILNSHPEEEEKKLPSTILGATFMLTNICLGTTIFTFAVKAKSFGLVWLLVCCTIVAIVNYWTITRGVLASSKCDKFDDFSEIVEYHLGKKWRLILNFFLILYSYACIMCFLALIFPLFGRFIQSAFYKDKYPTFEDFTEAKWHKAYIKFPFFVVLTFLLCLLCLIKDINKLNFSAYIGVAAVIYTLLVVMIECHGYYKYYKENKYIKEDKSTHPNWVNFGDAWKSDLDFFKGMANLFTAYACHPGIFPVYAGFKHNNPNKGIREMKLGTLFATMLTTALHFISIICSFLTDPYTPEDLVIYRKSKDSGKDIPMAIAKFAVFISLIFTLPAYYFTLRLSVADSFLKGDISPKFNKIFTFCSVFGCTVVAIVYDKILNYLSYIGGFISVFICYLIPVLLYIKSHGKPILYWKNLIQFIVAIILCIIGVTAGILTIIDDVSG